MNMKRILFICLTLACLSLILWGCTSNSQSNPSETKDGVTVPVEISRVERGDIAAFFSGTTTLEAEEETGVVAKVGGVVKKILVEEGDFVKDGQPLAMLDDEKLEVQAAQALANLKKLENNYQRSQELFKQNLISTEEFQSVKYEYEFQKATYDLAKLNLHYSTIRAPINGVISERLIKVGNMVQTNQATYRITDLQPLLAPLHVPEKHLNKLRVGYLAQLQIDAIEDSTVQGFIKRISPVVDPATGTVKVTVEVEDGMEKLKPGMFVRIKIVYDVHENTLLMPKDAILAEDRESTVYIVRDSLAYKQIVKTGYEDEGLIEILSGVAPGDTVVTTGKGSLKDSSHVEIVETQALMANGK